MPLPIIFAGLNSPILLSSLDQNFAALSALTPIPCQIAGTNALTLTPASAAPTVPSYANYQAFLGTAVATNTGGVTATVVGLAALIVYKDTAAGPVVLTGGEIFIHNLITVVYDSALSVGAGGFHLKPNW